MHLYTHVCNYHALNYSFLHVSTVCTQLLIMSIYLLVFMNLWNNLSENAYLYANYPFFHLKYLSVYLYIYLSIHRSIYLSIYLNITVFADVSSLSFWREETTRSKHVILINVMSHVFYAKETYSFVLRSGFINWNSEVHQSFLLKKHWGRPFSVQNFSLKDTALFLVLPQKQQTKRCYTQQTQLEVQVQPPPPAVKFRHGHMHWNTMLNGSHHLPSQVLLHVLPKKKKKHVELPGKLKGETVHPCHLNQ